MHSSKRSLTGTLFAFVLASLATPASAAPAPLKTPSFDCTKASTFAEHRICANPSLAALDSRLSDEMMEALDESFAALDLNGREASWLHGVRDACTTDSCLAAAYRARIATVRSILGATAVRRRAEAKASERVASDIDNGTRLSDTGLAQRLQRIAHVPCLKPAEMLDLGDRARAILAFECRPGMLSYQIYLFRPAGDAYQLVYSGYVGYLRGLELQDERSHGLRRLRLQQHESAAQHGVTYLDFDGSRYGCVAQAEEVFDSEGRLTFTIGPCDPRNE